MLLTCPHSLTKLSQRELRERRAETEIVSRGGERLKPEARPTKPKRTKVGGGRGEGLGAGCTSLQAVSVTGLGGGSSSGSGKAAALRRCARCRCCCPSCRRFRPCREPPPPPLCVFTCLLRWSLRMKRFAAHRAGKRFSPVWVRRCR